MIRDVSRHGRISCASQGHYSIEPPSEHEHAAGHGVCEHRVKQIGYLLEHCKLQLIPELVRCLPVYANSSLAVFEALDHKFAIPILCQ